jgi:predicted phage baseplate assembly protein
VGSAPARNRELRFEYWNGQSWARLLVSDGTNRLTQSGIVEFLGPSDIALSERFGIEGYWIRALFEAGDDQPVQMRALLPNTTFAVHAVTLRNEVLGSSDASVSQELNTARSPVLTGSQLEVRESNAASADAWIRWTEVPDFHASGAQDRHYVLDPMSGRVNFGDGVQGRIPPRGIGNIRMARYQTGGGSVGNRAAGTIVQLKTTVPYIEKVTNLEAARGGMEAESNASLVSRAPRMIRHGGRAVAFQDFEDLARNASPEVARAKSVPLRRLSVDPLGNSQVPGALSVIIVPQSSEAKPLPSSGLMTEVADYLRSLATPTLELVVVGPLYVRVDVTIEIALTSLEGATDVEQAVLAALRGFLHPLTGGRDGTGWDFGREPHTSDLHALVSDVPGVDHIRTLAIAQVEEPKDALLTGRFLVYSGQHRITLTFPGAE